MDVRTMEYGIIMPNVDAMYQFGISEFTQPISDWEKERRIHLAHMTLSVYTLDVALFKRDLQQDLERRGATIKYVDLDKTGFLYCTSIRSSHKSEKHPLFGCDQLVIKTTDVLCDEILLKTDQKHFEVFFHTSRELKGYADQVIYWR
jgi:hypothetical protein